MTKRLDAYGNPILDVRQFLSISHVHRGNNSTPTFTDSTLFRAAIGGILLIGSVAFFHSLESQWTNSIYSGITAPEHPAKNRALLDAKNVATVAK